MRRCDGNYRDGATARQHRVRVELDAARLRIVSHDDGEHKVRESWSVASMRRVDDRETKGSLRLKPNETGHARLIIEDREFAAALMDMGPHLRGRSAARRWRVGFVVAALGVLAIVLVAIGARYFSSWIAPLVPASWERSQGDTVGALVLEAFEGDARDCAGECGQQALKALSDRLTRAAGGAGGIRLRVASHGQIDALALPGGEIIMFRGLIEFAQSPDEVAGVMAHEIGHQLRGHPTQAMIRAMGFDLIVDFATGGDALGNLGQSAMRLPHGRDAEREADETGGAILASAGIDGGGIGRFLERLNEKPGDAPSAVRFLSAHPTLASQASRGAGGGRPALSPAEWRALREICSET